MGLYYFSWLHNRSKLRRMLYDMTENQDVKMSLHEDVHQLLCRNRLNFTFTGGNSAVCRFSWNLRAVPAVAIQCFRSLTLPKTQELPLSLTAAETKDWTSTYYLISSDKLTKEFLGFQETVQQQAWRKRNFRF